MKFLSLQDKQIFLSEMDRLDLLPSLTEDWQPDAALEAIFVRKRKKLIEPLKDFRKTQDGKNNWRANRAKIMGGIKTFHRSTAGKRFHRALGRYNSTKLNGNESFTLDGAELNEAVKALSSAVTHLHIEDTFFHPLMEQVEWECAYAYMLETFRDIEHALITSKQLTTEHCMLLKELIQSEPENATTA